MLIQIFDNGFYILRAERTLGVIVLVRSDVPYPAIDDLKKSFDRIDEALQPFDRSRFVIVFDVRRGPFRNDPVFEKVNTDRRRHVQQGFARRCVLVASAIGKIQIERHVAADPFQVDVFDDPEKLEVSLGVHGKLKL